MAQNMHRLPWIWLDLAPQILHHPSQQANVATTVATPDCVYQVAMRQNSAVRIEQQLQQLELTPRQRMSATAAMDATKYQINPQRWRTEARRFAAAPKLATQDLSDVCSQLVQPERFGDAIVHTRVQCGDDCLRVLTRHQADQWCRRSGLDRLNLISAVRWSEIQQHG